MLTAVTTYLQQRISTVDTSVKPENYDDGDAFIYRLDRDEICGQVGNLLGDLQFTQYTQQLYVNYKNQSSLAVSGAGEDRWL